MWELNKEYVRVNEEYLPFQHIESSLDGFVLEGSVVRAIDSPAKHPSTRIIVPKINIIYGRDVNERLSRYILTTIGLVVPEELEGPLQELELGLLDVTKTQFKVTPVRNGDSFSVRTMDESGHRQKRVDHVISVINPRLDEVLGSLGAPNDLFVDVNH